MSDSGSKDSFPSLKNPPLVETVLGLQFQPLKEFKNAHLGLFWKSLGNDWPFVTDVVALGPQYERFAEEDAWAQVGMKLRLSEHVQSRLQIRNATKDRMIQIQNGRLHLNWLGKEGGNYPRYEQIVPELEHLYQSLRQFLIAELKEEPVLDQWEMTYVNHIKKGTVWNDLKECATVFKIQPILQPDLAGTHLESLASKWRYEIPPQRGRLHVNLQHVRLGSPQGPDEALVLNLTARGPISNQPDAAQDLRTGLDLGHEVLVRAFFDLTSETAQQYWGVT